MKIFKYSVLIIFSILFSASSFSQIFFEKGYFIDNSGNKVECLIRSVGWIYNPTFFEYKLNDKDSKYRKEVDEVKEFGVTNAFIYISAKVKIDRSTDRLDDNEISNSAEPEWHEEQVLLKVLEDGDAKLFLYEEIDFIRFFYTVKQSPIEQLIYKRYKTLGETYYYYNSTYKNQLFVNVNCSNLSKEKFEKVLYETNSLRKVFKRCNRYESSTKLLDNNKGKWFYPKIIAGANYLWYRSGSFFNSSLANIKYNPKIGFTIGGELEFLLPFNNNKWSIILEVSTLSYNSSGKNGYDQIIAVDYNTVNALFGIRYYTFLSRKTKVLIDAAVSKDLKQLYYPPSLGAGIAYSKFTTEFRYYFQKGLSKTSFDQTPDGLFNNTSLTLRYSIF